MIEKIYSLSPVWVQNFACTIRGTIEKHNRMGGDFNLLFEQLKKSEWKSRVEIENYQIEKLRELLEYCSLNIPYYIDLFKEISFSPSDIKSLKDLERIPILTKEIVRENFERLKKPEFQRENYSCPYFRKYREVVAVQFCKKCYPLSLGDVVSA